MARRPPFDPRTMLAALERHYVDYVLIGGLARVLRGADEVTGDVDVCPSFARGNLDRLSAALSELRARGSDGAPISLSEAKLEHGPLALSTLAGQLNVVASPAGAPNGFADLRRAATNEHLGEGLRPRVASSWDLARMAAALGREQDLERLPALRRIVELEADRGHTVPQPARPQRATIPRSRRPPRAAR